MRKSLVVRNISFVLLISAAFMLVSAIVSLIEGNGSDFFPLLLSAGITSTVGIFPFIFVPKNLNLNTREINVFVVMAWFSSCIFGMLPYILWGNEFTIANAWFESVSGFTTTGSTILQDVESIPKGLLFWRSSTHFIGGIGVVMFALLVLQSQRTTKMRLTKAEVSELAKDSYHFKSHQLLRVIISVYVGLTVSLTIILMILGMSLYDAVNHSFSTIATGGFSTKNLSIASFNSVPIGIAIIIFMIISGMHFGMIYTAVTRRSKAIFRSPIIRFYLGSVGIGTLIVAISLILNGNYTNFFEALYQALFQVSACVTTTGFASADSSIWHPLAICILMFFSLQCACAGSTAGGIKTDRVYILWRSVVTQIKLKRHPNAVIALGTKSYNIDENSATSAVTYIALYLFIVFVSTAILSMFNIDLLSSISTVITFMGNVGPAFGKYGSLANFDSLPVFVKFTYPMLMLLGRLEIYGVFLLFIKSKYQ